MRCTRTGSATACWPRPITTWSSGWRARGVTLEVCPSSNVALGIAARSRDVPLRRLFEAGVPIALGADDPLLFGSRLVAQYGIARRQHGFTDAELADLARMSVLGSAAPDAVRTDLLAGIDAWLAAA